MAKTLRVRTKAGWVTKPAANLPENRLVPAEVDDNFLALEGTIENQNNFRTDGTLTPVAQVVDIPKVETDNPALDTPLNAQAQAIADRFEYLAGDDGAKMVGFKQAGIGAVSIDVQSKLRESVSVKDFGAVGDGVTDDTAAIQAAINAAFIVYFAEGVYKTSEALVLKTGSRLVGVSRVKSIIQNTTATADIACLKTNGTTMTEPFAIENLGLKSTNGPALSIFKGAQFKITNVKCSNSKYGLLADTCLVGNFDACAFDSNTVAGIKMTTSYDVDFVSCRVESNPIGVTLNYGTDSCYGIRFIGGTVEYNTSKNFELVNCFDTLLQGVWIEGGSKGVEAGGSSRNTTIASCQFINQSNLTWNGIGLHCLGQDRIVVRENRFSDASIVATGGRGMLQDNYLVGTLSTITLPVMPNLWSFITQTVQYTKEGTSDVINIYKQMRNNGTYELTSDINPDGYIKCNVGAICVAGDGVYRKTTGITDASGWVLLNATLKTFTTAGRPAATSVPVGYGIFNTTTGIPNYSNGSVWKDATGATV